jgi:DNA modification methylase
MTLEQYLINVKALRAYLKSDVIVPNSPGSEVVTRFITSEDTNLVDWVANYRNTAGEVNLWMINMLALRSSDEATNAVGTMDKPVDIILDFFFDYRQGTDASNSEEMFLDRLFSVDWILEGKRQCFPNGVRLLDWRFDIKLKPFSTDTTHWAQGVLKFQFDGIILP